MLDWNGAVLPYQQIIASMLSKRLFRGIRKKSIEFFQKIYRLFSDGIGETIRYLLFPALFPPILRSATSHSVRRNFPPCVLFAPARHIGTFRSRLHLSERVNGFFSLCLGGWGERGVGWKGMEYEKKVTEDESVTLLGCEQ